MRNLSVLMVVLLGTLVLITVSCSQPLIEGQNPGECENGADDDEDGLFDCADPDCVPAPACAGDDDDTAVTDDDDTFNDDDDTAHGDDDTDHGDDDSAGPGDDDDSAGTGPGDDDDTANPGENQNPGDCSDGIDNDGDGNEATGELVDCADPDCGNSSPECLGDDDDSAGDDDDSATGPTEQVCDDTLDDDGDFLFDCDDPDCFTDLYCQSLVQEICNNDFDDDFDGFEDCADSECTTHQDCTSGSAFIGSEVYLPGSSTTGSSTCAIGSGLTSCPKTLGNPGGSGTQYFIEDGSIEQLAVVISSSHGAIGELTLALAHPGWDGSSGSAGIHVLVTAGTLTGTDFVDTMFLNNQSCNGACPSIYGGTPPYSGDHSPDQYLDYAGYDINGEWTLTVTNTGSTSGSLDWSIWAVLQAP